MIVGPVRGRIAHWWKMSMLSFQRWASVNFGPVEINSCVVQTAPMLVGSTRPVFAPYWSARLAVGYSKARTASARARTAFEGASSETRDIHVRVHAILGKNRKNTQRTGRTHVTNALQKADFVRTSHGPQTPMTPQSLWAGHTRVSHACDLRIRYFIPRSHEALGQSTGPVRAEPV